MKLLKDRHDIAMAINFRKYPVLKIDLADSDDYGLKGCKVRIDAGKFRDGLPYTVDAQLRVYRDECKLAFHAGCVCLSNSYSYYDHVEMVEYAQAPLVGPDQEVVVALYDSRTKQVYAPMLVKTGSRVNPHCSTPLDIEPVDMTIYLRMAGCEIWKREEQNA